MVLEAARKLAPKVELILFAQASLTRLVPVVEQATGLPVLSSPRLAIEYTKKILDSLQAANENPNQAALAARS
jgi:hypothetical protein